MVPIHRKVVGWMLAATMAFSPAWAYAQPGTEAVSPPPDAELDLSYVTPGAVLAVVAHPRGVLTSPQMEMLPVEVISAAGKQELGLDPLDVEQVMLIVEPPAAGPPGFAAVIRLARPYQLDALKLPPGLALLKSQLEGRPYRQPQDPMTPGFFMPDDQTLLVGTDPLLRAMVANQKAPAEGPLSQLLARTSAASDTTAVAVFEPVRPMLEGMLGQAPVPPPLADVKRLPGLVDAAKLDLSVSGGPGVSLILLARDDAAAQELEQLLNQFLDLGQRMALAKISEEVKGDSAIEQANLQYAQRITRRMVELLRPQRSGRMLRIAPETALGSQMATVGVLVALLLPAVQAAREAARRAQSVNNLKQIAIAMHNYHAMRGSFPASASFDDQGKPLLSWRVHLLPLLEEQALYDEFHLDEPWDSEHNLRLIDRMPEVYHNPSSPAGPGKADYLVPVGKDSIFEGQKGTAFREIPDGISNTLLVLEVNPDAAVEWTRPSELEYSEDNPLAGLGRAHPGGFNAAIADGSVRFIAATVDPQVFLRLLMKADGQPIEPF